MASNDQIVAIQFTEGLETKADDKLVAATKLVVLENGEFTKQGSIRKRPGTDRYEALCLEGTQEFSTGNTTLYGTPRTVTSRGSELVQLTDERLYSFDTIRNRWVRKHRYYPFTHTTREIAYTHAAQTAPVCASSDGVRVVAWLDSRTSAQLRMSIYNTETGSAYVSDYVVATNATRPFAVPVTGGVLILWADTSTDNVLGRYIRSANVLGSYSSSNITYISDLGTSNNTYSVCGDGENIYIAYIADGTDSDVAIGVGMKGFRPGVGGGGTALTVWKAQVDTSTNTWRELDCVYNINNNQIGIIWGAQYAPGPGQKTFYAVHEAATGGVVTATTDLSTVSSNRVGAAPHYDSVNGHGFTWAYEDDSTISTYFVNPTTGTRQVYHARLISSGFTLPSGIGAFLMIHQSVTGLQNSYYLYTDEGNVFGQILYQQAYYGGTSVPMARVWANANGYEVALSFQRQVDAATDKIPVFTHAGIQLVQINTVDVTPTTVEVDGILYASGSMLWAYDGQTTTEAAPLMYPDMRSSVIAAGTASVSSALNENTDYSYRVYYVFHRANGSRVRSAAISVTKATGTGGGSLNDSKLTLTIPTLGVTNWQDNSTEPSASSFVDCSIEVYRTLAGNTTNIYYRVSSPDPSTSTAINGYIYNNPNAASVTFVDEMTDTTAQSKEIDYISQGELENIPCPGPATLGLASNRVFAAGGALPPGTVQFSKLHQPRAELAFNDALIVDNVPESGGDIVGFGEINDTPVVFKEDAIFALAGGGPDNLGGSGTYNVSPITTDVGCANGNTIVRIPMGLMFKSNKGIYQLDQAFNVTYTGAPVESFNSQNLVGAHLVPDTNQVIFLASSGVSLMYDYLFNQWSTFTHYYGVSATLWGRQQYVFLREDGTIFVRNPDSWTDGGTYYRLKFRTGPVRLDEVVQRFHLFKRLMVLGEYFTPHKLQVGLLYNREPAPYEEWVWDPSGIITTDTWGDDATWGSGSYWGGELEGSTYQHEHAPKRTKEATVRIEITEIPQSPYGRGFEISELAMRIKSRDGLQRIGATRKY